MNPSSVILEEFWLGTGIVMCSGHPIEVWLGGNERRVARSIQWVWYGVMCECGYVLDLVDGRVLSFFKTKVAGSS